MTAWANRLSLLVNHDTPITVEPEKKTPSRQYGARRFRVLKMRRCGANHTHRFDNRPLLVHRLFVIGAPMFNQIIMLWLTFGSRAPAALLWCLLIALGLTNKAVATALKWRRWPVCCPGGRAYVAGERAGRRRAPLTRPCPLPTSPLCLNLAGSTMARPLFLDQPLDIG